MIELFSNFIRNIKEIGFEAIFNRYYSIYRAQVTDNTDPLNRGRVKLKVPALFGDEELPYFAQPRNFRGAGPGKGEFYPPDVDDWVFVEFEMGDSRFPIYSGGWHGDDEVDADNFPHEQDVPQARGYINKYGHTFTFSEKEGEEKISITTPAGHFLILDDTSGKEALYFIHNSGAQFQIDADGSVKMVAKNGAFLNMDAKNDATTITSKDGATIALDTDIKMLDSSGKSILNMSEDTAQMTTNGDWVQSGKTATLSGGAITLDAQTVKFKMGSGKMALGTPATELIDQVIQGFDALVQSPALCTTGVGPSSPLLPPASVQLTLIKTLLTVIKDTI